MGEGVTVKCSECSYERGFTLGIGMAYWSLEVVVGILPPDKRKEVEEICKHHDVMKSDYSHTLFRCPECNRLTSLFWMKLHYDRGEQYETVYQCRKCKCDLVPVEDDNVSGLPCPKCGKVSLTSGVDIMWD